MKAVSKQKETDHVDVTALPPPSPPPPPPAFGRSAIGASRRPVSSALTIDYPEQLSRLTTAFRIILVIPIAIVLGILTNSSIDHHQDRRRGVGHHD